MPKADKSKWSGERKALKNVQVHFDFQQKVQHAIRHAAAEDSITPSDMVRKIVGLQYKKVQRPRIAANLSSADREKLAERYGISPQDALILKQKVMEEVSLHFYQQDKK